DDQKRLTLAFFRLTEPVSSGQAKEMTLSELVCLWPDSPKNPFSSLRLGSFRVDGVSAERGFLAKAFGLANLRDFLADPQPFYRRLSADLAVSRQFGSRSVQVRDFSLAARRLRLTAEKADFAPLAERSLKAAVSGLSLDLDPPQALLQANAADSPLQTERNSGLDGSDDGLEAEERSAAAKDPKPNAEAADESVWPIILVRSGLTRFEAALTLTLDYDQSAQTFRLDVEQFEMPALAAGRLSLELAHLDQGSLESLGRLAAGNAFAPFLEPGLHHSSLERLVAHVDDLGLARRLLAGLLNEPLSAEATEADAKSVNDSSETPANAESGNDPSETPADAESGSDLIDTLAGSESRNDPTATPADAESANDSNETPSDAESVNDPSETPTDAESANAPNETPADAESINDPNETPAVSVSGNDPIETPAAPSSATGGMAETKARDVQEQARRLADLLEMLLTISLDNSVANTKELSERLRDFLAAPESLTLLVEPDPPLTPGEARLSKNKAALLNSVNVRLAFNQRSPIKILFRTDPEPFDRDYVSDDYGLYPGETYPKQVRTD
ncbi:MAG: MSCRAMM family adhesin SdrC, partial [Deltaproteobacteria bacterium]|nr:MSCRAMM family adhesin SdrC [Deltaproteobacteria bacterium]